MSEKKERKAAILKTLTAALIVLTLAAGLVTATVLVGRHGRAEVGGKITAESLDEYIIRYSVETETAFLDAARIYFSKLFRLFLTPGGSFQASWLSRPLLLAMQRAGISADKVLKFADYLRAEDPSGVIIIDNSDPAKPKISVLPNGVDFIYIISDIVAKTGITPDELGTFIYEHLLDSSDSERQLLLKELGKENFITIFIDTSEIYGQILAFAGNSSPSLSEGRMAREILYELGSRYRKILNDFGAEKLEKLFGIGDDIINIDGLPDELKELAIIENINAVSRAMEGITGYYFGVLSRLLTDFDAPSVDLPVTDALVKYLSGEGDAYYVYAALKTIKAAEKAHGETLTEFGLSEEEIIVSLSEIAARLRAAGDADNTNYPAYAGEEREFVEDLFSAMRALSGESKSIEEIGALPAEEIERLKEEIEVFARGMEKFDAGIKKAQSFILIAMLFGMLPKDAF